MFVINEININMLIAVTVVFTSLTASILKQPCLI